MLLVLGQYLLALIPMTVKATPTRQLELDSLSLADVSSDEECFAT